MHKEAPTMIGTGSVTKADKARAREARAATDTSDKKRAEREFEKRVSAHPIYHLLERAATSGELPHQDELKALNVTQKYRTEIVAAARRIKHEAESPPEADEVRTRTGKVKVNGVTSSAYAAKSMAHDKATEFVKGLPSNHETQGETEARQASADPEAVADTVMARMGRTR